MSNTPAVPITSASVTLGDVIPWGRRLLQKGEHRVLWVLVWDAARKVSFTVSPSSLGVFVAGEIDHKRGLDLTEDVLQHNRSSFSFSVIRLTLAGAGFVPFLTQKAGLCYPAETVFYWFFLGFSNTAEVLSGRNGLHQKYRRWEENAAGS